MSTEFLNQEARALHNRAVDCVRLVHDKELRPEHLLHVMLVDDDATTDVSALLQRNGITFEALQRSAYWQQRNRRQLHGRPTRAPSRDEIRECDSMDSVYKYARRNLEVTNKHPRRPLRPVDLLIGIVMLPCPGVSDFFKGLGVDYVKLRTDAIHLWEQSQAAA